MKKLCFIIIMLLFSVQVYADYDNFYLYSEDVLVSMFGDVADDDDLEDDEGFDNEDYYDCYYTDGYFSIDAETDGIKAVALYKNSMLTGFTTGERLFVYNIDFDSLAVFRWGDFENIVPVAPKIELTREEVFALPPTVAKEPVYGDIPSVYLTGDTTDMSKTTEVLLNFLYESGTDRFEGYLTAKWQGNYAAQLPKKNFSVNLYKDENCEKKLKRKFMDWDKSNKFTLKANYVDSTAARNIVSARLYKTLPDAALPNGSYGVVDGFPVRLYLNGEYQGLYTWNMPKRSWIFGMKDENPDEYLYFARFQVGSGLFKNKCSLDRYWDLMHPDELDNYEAIDRVTGFVAECTDEEFKEHVTEYLDFNSLLNFYVFSQIITNHDGTGKNMNLASYDGNIWYIRPYDLDATYGIEWYGWQLKPYDFDMSENNFRLSVLWTKLEDNFPQEIYDRYILVRNNQMSEENILAAFRYFMTSIGDDLYAEDLAVWPKQPSRNYRYPQIEQYIYARYQYLDGYMERFNVEDK